MPVPLPFDGFVSLHPSTPQRYGSDAVLVDCPACAARSLVLAYIAEGEPHTATCLPALGGRPRSQHIDLGCTPADIARALHLTEKAYRDALHGVAPVGRGGIDWTVSGRLEDLDRARLVLAYVRSTGRDVSFSYESNGWLIWDGTIWAPTHSVGPLVHEISDHFDTAAGLLFDQARAEKDKEKSTALQSKANATLFASRGCRVATFIESTSRVLRDLPGVVVSLTEYDRNPDLLQVANGVLDLRTGDLREPRKEDRITRRLSVNYRPEATAPLWEKFLSEVFITEPDEAGKVETDSEVIAYMRRLIGYGVTGHTTEQCFAVLHGRGGNGKGVLLNTLSRVFAPITQTTPFATFEERAKGSIPNDIAALRNARLVLASEGEASSGMAESVIKSVTGSDPITARFMRAEFFTFEPQFLILMATNYKPSLRGQDEGLWRRVKLIAFRASFTGASRDDRLEHRLAAEAEGVLAWAVRGSVEWAEHGLAEPASITSATAAYRSESDRLGDFIAERLVVTGDHLMVSTLTEVWRAYLDYTTDEHEIAMRRHNFANALGERPNIRRDKRSGREVYRGVRLSTTAERSASDKAAKRALSAVADEDTGTD